MINWISVRSLLSIASIHKFPNISIDFALEFNQYDLDVDFIMDLPLGIEVDGNIG